MNDIYARHCIRYIEFHYRYRHKFSLCTVSFNGHLDTILFKFNTLDYAKSVDKRIR